MSDLERLAKKVSERAAKNAGIAPQLLYAPVLWALEDEWKQRNAVFDEALAQYPYSRHALHFLWNNAMAAV